MIKAVGYACPTSPRADKLDSYRDGCYYVETKRNEAQINPSKLFGPFATRLEAYAEADSIDAKWSRYTMERK